MASLYNVILLYKLSRAYPGFVSTTDILDQVILAVEDCTMHCRMFPAFLASTH